MPAPAAAPRDDAPGLDAAQLPARHAGTGLWLALEFPRLPLEATGPVPDPGGVGPTPRAVVVHEGRRALLLCVDDTARAAGLRPGMAPGAAAALCPRLRVERHDPEREGAALEGLATWAGRYTSRVSLQPPRGLLLEIGASLRLFGGLGPLLDRLRRDLRALGVGARRGVAPTPAAAWLLARAGDGEPVTLAERLPGRLACVPAHCLGLSGTAAEDLQALGVRTFGDCARLPRDGLGRRLGPELVALLDRALGRRPDPRLPWTPPERFERRLDLPFESADRALLLRAVERMLHEMCGFLAARVAGAAAIELQLAHRRGPATRLTLELVVPCRDPLHLRALVAERIERVRLEHDVVHLGLRVERLAPLAPGTGDLYGGACSAPGGEAGDAQVLVERLRARLGRDAVRGLVRVADHRPERASAEPPWRWAGSARPPGRVRGGAPAFAGPDPQADLAMPPWLLPEPRALGRDGHAAGIDGPLSIERGPARIESGWWDGGDAARDYYVARARNGSRYWIFREVREPRRWFVHGIFA